MNWKNLAIILSLLTVLLLTSCSYMEAPPPHYNDFTNITVNNASTLVIRSSNETVTVYNPVGMHYYKKGNTTGELRIHLPYVPNNAYITIEMEAKESDYYSLEKIIFSGQATSAGWNSSTTDVQLFANDNAPFNNLQSLTAPGFHNTPPLRIGAGLFNTNYNDLYWKINKVTITGTNTTLDWANGWSYEYITTFAFPSKNGQLQEFWSNLNDGVGSGLDADRFGSYPYQYYVYGNNQRSIYSSTANYSLNLSDKSQMTRLLIGGANNPIDNPIWLEGSYSSGNPYGWFINYPLIDSTNYALQMYSPSHQDRVFYRRCYTFDVGCKNWFELLTPNFGEYKAKNTNFTGNHTQNGLISSFVPDMHGYVTQVLNLTSVDTWYNLTFNDSMGEVNGFNFYNNQTLEVIYSGHYEINFQVSIKDSAPSPSAIIGFRILKNGEELEGSYTPGYTDKQQVDLWKININHADLEVGDNLTMQVISSDNTVSVETDATYSDKIPIHAKGYIKRALMI